MKTELFEDYIFTLYIIETFTYLHLFFGTFSLVTSQILAREHFYLFSKKKKNVNEDER